MEKRVLIAVLLSIAVLYGYSFFAPQPPAPPVVEQKQAAQAPAETSAVPSPSGVVPALSVPSVPEAGPEKDVTVETDLYTVVFSSRGGSLKKLVLKNYYTDEGAVSGNPIALIDAKSVDAYTLRTSVPSLGINPAAVYSVQADTVKISGNESHDVDFHYASPEGVVVRKTYTITGNSYSMALKEQIANSGSAVRKASPQVILSNRIDPKGEEASFEIYGPVSYSNELITEKVKDLLKGAVTYPGGINWTGFGDKYFLNAIVGTQGTIGSVQLVRTPANYVENIITAPEVTLNPGQTATVEYKVYLGPKDLDILKAQGNNLEEAIDFGWFSSLAKPLLYSMKYFYNYTGNYGVAIIIITVILKILFFPLTHKSYKAMKEMQKLQPKMNELREKFKSDRDAMNRAVMELYKTHKVNPLGGCLPMLVQIPVFFALYKALMYSIELRHAPFMLWITDLSAKDPYYVTPVIMGVTMFIQQKMTPTNMDPIQAKMMLALPVVFTFMFLNFPSGLVLYWLVNNILTIAQQVYINKSLATES